MLFTRQYWHVVLVCIFTVSGLSPVYASISPKKVVDDTTAKVLTLSKEAKAYIDDDPQRFYAHIDELMNEVIDFKGFARSVMGKYASRKRYDSLPTVEDKKAFKAQITRFTEKFRTGLIQTYAKGLFAFEGTRAETDPIAEDYASKRSVTVAQRIYKNTDVPFLLHYKLRADKRGNWKLRNVTIEGINVGYIYRSQFESAVKEHKGDIDKVIDNWSSAATSVAKAKKVEAK